MTSQSEFEASGKKQEACLETSKCLNKESGVALSIEPKLL